MMKKKEFSLAEIMAFEQRYRATFINSLGGFKSVCLVGTRNKQEQTNLAVFSSIVHIGANPPLIGFVVRPDTAERHTLENILDTGFYTLNHIHEGIVEKAHQTSARYPGEVSEFTATGLTEEYKSGFYAPFVKESHVQIGLEFRKRVDFEINGTIFMTGQVTHVFVPEHAVGEDGFVKLESAGTITCSGLDSYHSTRFITRLSYAKPDKWPVAIDGNKG